MRFSVNAWALFSCCFSPSLPSSGTVILRRSEALTSFSMNCSLALLPGPKLWLILTMDRRNKQFSQTTICNWAGLLNLFCLGLHKSRLSSHSGLSQKDTGLLRDKAEPVWVQRRDSWSTLQCLSNPNIKKTAAKCLLKVNWESLILSYKENTRVGWWGKGH